MKRTIFLVGSLLIAFSLVMFFACTASETLAEQAFKASTLRVNSTVEIVTATMGRSPDSIEPSLSSSNRLFKYRYSDGSVLIISMKPIDNQGGLVLEYMRTE